MYFSSLQIYFISVVLFFFYFNVTEWLNYVRIWMEQRKTSICILLDIKLEASNKNEKPVSVSVFKMEAK